MNEFEFGGPGGYTARRNAIMLLIPWFFCRVPSSFVAVRGMTTFPICYWKISISVRAQFPDRGKPTHKAQQTALGEAFEMGSRASVMFSYMFEFVSTHVSR